MAEHAENMAKKYGALIIDGKNHFSTLEQFRKPSDPWHDSSQESELCIVWEVLFKDLLEMAQFGVPDHLYHHCCQSFPEFPIGYVQTEPTVDNPQVNIESPNSAVVPPQSSLVDPEIVAEVVDNSRIVFIPTDDVKVVLKRSDDELGRNWLALTYDCIQVLGESCGEVDATMKDCASGAVAVKKHIEGPRPTSCNTHKSSDQSVTPSIHEEPVYNVLQQQHMLPSTLRLEAGNTTSCTKNTVYIFDGCGTHTTLGFLLPEFGPIFRATFEAALAFLPDGSHFVTGTKLNHSVLPTASIAKAHSFMIDLNRDFIFDNLRLVHWVGEFFPAFDFVHFIEIVWEVAWQRVKAANAAAAAEDRYPQRKPNLHCSLPAYRGSNITGSRWEGITHCRYLSGTQPDNSQRHIFMSREMDEHLRRALEVVAKSKIIRTDINGGYVFAPCKHCLLSLVNIEPFDAINKFEQLDDVERKAMEADTSAKDDESAESGTASVSSLAKKELLVADSQRNAFGLPEGSMEDEAAHATTPKMMPRKESISTVRGSGSDSPKAPHSLKNVIIQTAVNIRDVITSAVTGSTSSSSNHWTDRAKEEQDRTANEWSAGAASQRASMTEPPSAQSGTSSSQLQVPMEVEIEGYTQEQMARARDAAMAMRPSLKLAYNQVLDVIGSTGLVFKKPQPADASDYPAAAAVPSEAPPDEILKYDIFTNSSGQRFDQLGHAQGWPGIERQFNLSDNWLAYTGFEPEMKALSESIPTTWESWRCLWWNPLSITPKGYYWKEVEVNHPALSPGRLSNTTDFTQPPTFGQILRRWFFGRNDVFHRACKGVTTILRHTGGLGSRRRRGGDPAVPMSTFGWCEAHHLAEAVGASTWNQGFDAAGMLAALKNELIDMHKKKSFNIMMIMASAESGTQRELGPAPAIIMKDSYYLPRRGIFSVPPDSVLQKSHVVLLRADHGHGDLFKGVISNVQRRAYQDLLDAGAGLFHATQLKCLMPILRDGILPMGRAASMFSMFHHQDTQRSRNLQRFNSEHEIIISIRSEEITKFVPLTDMFVASGNISVQVPVPRFAFDRIVEPGRDGGLVLFDSSWADETVEGTVSPFDDPDRPRPAVASEETKEQFVERAQMEGWDGPIFSCPGCKGVNPCGMLVCVHCRSPFLFRLRAYPDYLVSPMARKIVCQVVEKSCPQLQVPNPVRRDTSEVARA